MHSSGPARRRFFLRAKAFLLLAVFLSAGTSLPSIDALAYHQDSSESERSRPHFEAAGGCLSHADQCTLGRTASGSAAVAGLGAETRLAPVSGPTTPRIIYLQPACARHGALPQPRAPPVSRYV